MSVTRAVKERFDAGGVSIPFPQRDIHVYQESSTQDADKAVMLPRSEATTAKSVTGANPISVKEQASDSAAT